MTFYSIWCQKGAQIALSILPFHQSEKESRRADCGGVLQTAEGKAQISHCTYLQVLDVSDTVCNAISCRLNDAITTRLICFFPLHSNPPTCIREEDFLGEQGLWEWHHLLFRFNFLCLQNKSCNEAITKFDVAAKLTRADIIKTAMSKEWVENKVSANVAEKKDFIQQKLRYCTAFVSFFMWSLLNCSTSFFVFVIVKICLKNLTLMASEAMIGCYFLSSWLFMMLCVKLRASPPNQPLPLWTGAAFIRWLGELVQSMLRCSCCWWVFQLPRKPPVRVLVRASSCGRSRQTDTRARADPRVQDEGKPGFGGDHCRHLRDSQLSSFGDFSGDRLLVHHWGEPCHEHEWSELPLGTVDHTRRCGPRLFFL